MSDEKLPEFDENAPGVIATTCEFCHRPYWIDVPNLRLAHDVPHCPEFQALDVIEFMHENNQRKIAKRPSA